jgi:hypothetical protein
MGKMIPDNSPLVDFTLVCRQCGQTLMREVVRSKQGVTHLEYSCVNPEVGCSYKLESTTMMQAEMRGLRVGGEEVEL